MKTLDLVCGVAAVLLILVGYLFGFTHGDGE